MKIGRNDKCWCGSGKKFKQCHLAMEEKIAKHYHQGDEVPTRELLKTIEQIEGIRHAGKINTMVLDKVAEVIKEGMSTEELNKIAHEYTLELGGIPAPLNYHGFPKSICTSINEVVCHGIPSEDEILKSGDIVNVDVTTIVNGYYADASRMFMIGEVDEEKQKLVRVAKECLDLGLAEAKPWGYIGDIGAAIVEHATKNGYTVVQNIGGHGVGVEFHEEQYVSHVGVRGTDCLIVPGMTFTIEPMINMGVSDIEEHESDGWTIYTADRKPTAQWEYTILITGDGAEILAY